VHSIRTLLCAVVCFASAAISAGELFDSGKLLGTGGVSQIEGAGGGGLVPWALITGYGSDNGIGANAHATYVGLSDFTLWSEGAAIGFYDRFELSYAHQSFSGRGTSLDQDVVGAKLRLIGDAVYDQDRWMPQIAAGLQYKSDGQGAVVRALGANKDSGVDYYLAATKLLLADRLLLDATLRLTEANQFGLLGFSGAYSAQFEGSVGFFVSRKLVLGADFRSKPDNLAFAKEGNAFDLFAAYFLNKNLSATLAYVDLGDIALQGRQTGIYASLQCGF
jgi:hypothetical protein